MKTLLHNFGVVVACLALLGVSTVTAEPNVPEVKAAIIPCKGMIDDGLYKSIQRRTQTALDSGVTYLIYEIGTYGGLLKSGDDIAKYFILDTGKKAHTVAYITTEAISAGAMISVSCQDIIMLENTTIGDCAPIQLGGKLEGVEREKTESFTRAAFDRAAEANHYPKPLLKAMVTMQTEVYSLRNIETGKIEYFETVDLPKDPNKYDLENKKLIVPDTELLTLTSAQALEYGVARAVVADQAGVFEFLAERDGVVFVGQPVVLEMLWSENMVRWINSPAVMGILIMLTMLGVYMELNTPGVGLPGLVALICITIIVGSKFAIDLANWLEVAILIIGIILLTLEIFVIPGFGIAGILGIFCIMAGVFGMLIKNPPDEIPWPKTNLDWQLFIDGVLGLAIGVVGFSIFAWLFAKYMPKMQFLSGLTLSPAKAGHPSVSMTAPAETKKLTLDIGDTGQVISQLRPAGHAQFGERIVDVIAEANFLDKGTKIKIIEIQGNRVVVKELQ